MTNNRVASTNPDAPTSVAQAFDPAWGVEHDTAAGAIAIKEGTVILDAALALAMTLVAPTAGAPSAGGDDGKELTIICKQAQANTVTTPANGINGNKHVITFSAAVANCVTLVAYNGVWYCTLNVNGTLT